MSDETTARDRAIKDMTVALTPYLGDRIFGLPQTPDAVLAAVWPLVERYAQDEVLRALAAAPTAPAPHPDPCTTCSGYGVVYDPGHYVPGEQFVEPPSEDRCEDCVGTGTREVQVLRKEAAQHTAAERAWGAELQRLRARDEAAKALARWWNGLGGCSQAVLRDPRRGFRAGADALDALARAHETGGQDR